MMKKMNDQWQKAKCMLLSAVVAAGLAACAEHDNPAGADNASTEVPQQVEDPTDDQMAVSVTANLPTAVLGQFDDTSMAAALIRRVQAPTFTVNAGTKLALLRGSDIEHLSNDDIIALAKLYASGGYLAFEKPTGTQLIALSITMALALATAENELLTSDGDVTITSDNPQAARRATSALAENLKSRAENIGKIATRGTDDLEEALDKVAGEMVIIGPDSYYFCVPYNGGRAVHAMTDSNGNTVEEEEIVMERDYTRYRSGLMADGAAQWLNTRQQSIEERQAQARRLTMTRSTAEGAINDLMSASDEFTLQGHLHGRNNYGAGEDRESAYHRTIAVWGVYDTKNDRDYYYVQQKVRMEIGGKQEGHARWEPGMTLYHGPYTDNIWVVGDFTWGGTRYKYYYGSWLDSYLSKLKLTGQGTIRVEQSTPFTDNNDVSRSISIGESHSSTNTIGFSMGGSFGSQGASFNPSINYSYGWTDGTSFEITNTTISKELKCAKNTNGSEVTWKYECGKKMEVYENNNNDYCHTMAPDALVNDVDIDNQVCWSVTNPVGEYSLDVYEEPGMKSLMKAEKGSKNMSAEGSAWYNNSYTLKAPNRAVQEWRMDVTFPEIGQEGHHGDRSKLEETLKRHFPDLYQPVLRLADQTPTSENTIKHMVGLTKALMNNADAAQTLREFALDLGLSEFTIKWYCNDGNHPNSYNFTVKAKEEKK